MVLAAQRVIPVTQALQVTHVQVAVVVQVARARIRTNPVVVLLVIRAQLVLDQELVPVARLLVSV